MGRRTSPGSWYVGTQKKGRQMGRHHRAGRREVKAEEPPVFLCLCAPGLASFSLPFCPLLPCAASG